MEFIHSKCGGKVDNHSRTCQKCGKKWNRVSIITTSELRMATNTSSVSFTKSKGRKPLTPAEVASHLPKWPRWARILSSLAVVCLIVVLIVLWRC